MGILRQPMAFWLTWQDDPVGKSRLTGAIGEARSGGYAVAGRVAPGRCTLRRQIARSVLGSEVGTRG